MIENQMHKIVYFSLSQIRRHVQNQKHYFTNHHNTVSKKYQKFFVKSNCYLFLYFFSPILTTRLLHHWILSIPWVKNINNFSSNQMVLFFYFFQFFTGQNYETVLIWQIFWRFLLFEKCPSFFSDISCRLPNFRF